MKSILFLTLIFFQIRPIFIREIFNENKIMHIKNKKMMNKLFDKYLKSINKSYTNLQELKFRYKIFENNISKILKNSENIHEKYKIIEIIDDNNKEKIILKPINPCEEIIALNSFVDLSKQEFENSYLLPKEFFDKKKIKNGNEINNPFHHFKGKSFHGKNDWISDYLKSVLNDENFDVFKMTLKNRQNPKKKKKLKQRNYNEHFIHDNFKKFTLFDIKKKSEELDNFLYETMPNYNLDDYTEYTKSEEDRDTEQERECLNYLIKNKSNKYGLNLDSIKDNYFEDQNTDNEGRNLQSWYGGNSYANNQNSSFSQDPFFNNQNSFSSQNNSNNYSTNYSTNNSNNYSSNYSNNYSSNYPKRKKKRSKNFNSSHITLSGVRIPTYLNWNSHKSLSPVKDQGKCNSCYAFGAISGLEAHNILKKNNHSTFSEQEILDCSNVNKACSGGQPFMVFDYIKQHGIHLDSDYPYKARKQNCKRNNRQKKFFNLKGYIFTKEGIKNLLIAASNGPIIVVSYASDHLKYYYNGIYKGQGCSKGGLPNHASLLYGYNLKAPIPYLLFKNNWGNVWGNNGYYKVAIGDLEEGNNGHCLIAGTQYNTMPLV